MVDPFRHHAKGLETEWCPPCLGRGEENIAAVRTWAARSLVGRTTSALRECREPPPRPSLRIKGASGHTSVACMSAVQCPEVPLEYLLMGCLHRSDLIVITVRRHHLMQPAGL